MAGTNAQLTMSPWAKKLAHNEIRRLYERGWSVDKIATFTNTPCSKVRKVLGLDVPKKQEANA